MKKAIKNYLARLQENKTKGFSLVELIIVMAIMAILVGIVASQVIPYMEKARQAKDQQQLSTLTSSVVSAIAQDATFDQSTVDSGGLTFQLTDMGGTNTTDAIAGTLADLSGAKDAKTVEANLIAKMKSKAATTEAGKIYVEIMPSGKVTTYLSKDGTKPTNPKMFAESE